MLVTYSLSFLLSLIQLIPTQPDHHTCYYSWAITRREPDHRFNSSTGPNPEPDHSQVRVGSGSNHGSEPYLSIPTSSRWPLIRVHSPHLSVSGISSPVPVTSLTVLTEWPCLHFTTQPLPSEHRRYDSSPPTHGLSKPSAPQNTRIEALRRLINRKHRLDLNAFSQSFSRSDHAV